MKSERNKTLAGDTLKWDQVAMMLYKKKKRKNRHQYSVTIRAVRERDDRTSQKESTI
jgi:hypothetical protein